MTAIPSFAFPDMDASQLDDKMDVASSPFRHPDDVDIDLDSVRDPSVIGSVNDEMVDDTAQPTDPGHDAMLDLFDEVLPDDDMLDTTKQDVPAEQHNTDYNMDGFNEETQRDEDEDILYEDEEDARPPFQQNEDTVEYHNDQEPQDYYEADAEGILEEFEKQPESQEQVTLATNESESLPLEGGIIPGSDTAQDPGKAQQPQDATLEPFQEYGVDEAEEGQAPEQEQTEQHENIEYLEQPEQFEPDEQLFERENITRAGDGAQATATADNPSSQELVDASEERQHEDTAKSKGVDNMSQSVHAVTLVYLEEEMSLFPPMLGDASSVYFLPDSSLAFEPVDKLLAACREILTGTLDHHDELVLDVPGLGLHICEDSKYAAQITLAQVLDVYLHLCHNDEGQEVRPLYCHLSSRVSLASQYAYLTSAGGEGKTYAEIAADHLDSPELESENAEATDYQEQQDNSSQLPFNGEAYAVEDQADDRPSTEHAEDGQAPDNLNAEGRAQKDNSVESAAQADPHPADTTADVPAPDADHSETLAGTEASEGLDLHEEAYPQDTEQEYVYDETQGLDFTGGEHEQGPQIAGQPEDGHEHETNSSHTVEGDAPDAALQGISTEDFGAEYASLDKHNEQGDDVFEPEEGALELQAGYEPYGDEELFTAQDEDGEIIEEGVTTDLPAEDQSSTLQDASEHEPSQDVISFSANGDLSGQKRPQPASGTDLPVPANLSPPMTPLQAKQAKRKAEDDDELLFLDLDTPDPKRRRPS